MAEKLSALLEYSRAVVKKTWALASRPEPDPQEAAKLDAIGKDVQYIIDNLTIIRDEGAFDDVQRADLDAILGHFAQARERMAAHDARGSLESSKKAYQALRKFIMDLFRVLMSGAGQAMMQGGQQPPPPSQDQAQAQQAQPQPAPEKVKIDEQAHLTQYEKERIDWELKRLADKLAALRGQQEQINEKFEHLLAQKPEEKDQQTGQDVTDEQPTRQEPGEQDDQGQTPPSDGQSAQNPQPQESGNVTLEGGSEEPSSTPQTSGQPAAQQQPSGTQQQQPSQQQQASGSQSPSQQDQQQGQGQTQSGSPQESGQQSQAQDEQNGQQPSDQAAVAQQGESGQGQQDQQGQSGQSQQGQEAEQTQSGEGQQDQQGQQGQSGQPQASGQQGGQQEGGNRSEQQGQRGQGGSPTGGSPTNASAGSQQRMRMLQARQRALEEHVAALAQTLDQLPMILPTGLSQEQVQAARQQTREHLAQAMRAMQQFQAEIDKAYYESGSQREATMARAAEQLIAASRELDEARRSLESQYTQTDLSKLIAQAREKAENLLDLAEAFDENVTDQQRKEMLASLEEARRLLEQVTDYEIVEIRNPGSPSEVSREGRGGNMKANTYFSGKMPPRQRARMLALLFWSVAVDARERQGTMLEDEASDAEFRRLEKRFFETAAKFGQGDAGR